MKPLVTVPSFDLVPLLTEGAQKLVDSYPYLLVFVKEVLNFLIIISFPLSAFFLIGIIYCVERLKKIKKLEDQKYDLKVEPAFEDGTPAGANDLAVQWQKVTSLLSSQNQNDWKQAILEADTMLDEILTGIGYQGETIGEKLKRVQSGDMKSVQSAWDAHKIRNQIAHEGSSFQLTHHEANQAIQKYREVFEEFYYI